MKRIICFALSMLSGFFIYAQRAQDSVAIEKQIDAMLNSWNRHDYSDMDNYVTPDCDWVNIVGIWWQGSKAVKFAHQFYHDRMFKHTSQVRKSTKISFLSADVALVQLYSHIGSFTTPEGKTMPEGDDLATLVYVRKDGQWLLRAGENVVVNPEAQQFDPARQMPR